VNVITRTPALSVPLAGHLQQPLPPEVGVAAAEALETAGYHVVLPEGHVCCGRPLYDYGFLRLARRYLEGTLDLLRHDIRAGIPVVKATGGIGSDRKLLESMGAQGEAPDSGCCGLAGSLGYEAKHYEVSMACGERSLLPAMRNASADTLLVADGFSCRTQIEQGARRRPLHLAQVLALAERGEVPAQPRDGAPGKLLVGALLACGAVYAGKRAWPT
jgi:Fe-S oxidoreductase